VGRILQLPQNLRLKIAAGEVIESPASVVKELIENSIDAGATLILIEIEGGGLKKILVRDNGEGIAPDDLPLAVQRFSTSKLKSEQDLERISTLGFRGEALASICAISRMKIISKTADSEGHSISCNEGEIGPVMKAPHPGGTTVEVRDIFFNLPARRKFLPSVSSLFREISKVFQHAALSRPGIHFTLIRDGREIANFPPASNLRERILQVMGKEFLDSLMEIEASVEEFYLKGFSSKRGTGRVRPTQIFFLNGRPIKNKELSAAINNAYSGILEKPKLPDAVVFLHAPPESFDVNVHPSKREVKFKKTGAIFSLFSKAVRVKGKEFTGEPGPIPRFLRREDRVEDASSPYPWERGVQKTDIFPASLSEGDEKIKILGQVRNLFIVVEKEDGLYLVDQHNAQERIIFERLRNEGGRSNILLIPLVLDLREDDLALLNQKEGELKRAGFNFEVVSGSSLIIKGIPSLLPASEAESAFVDALRGKDKVLATIACKASVKRGEPLSLEKMQNIVENLFKIDEPELCPHGRPTFIKFAWKDLARLIGRKDI